LTYFHIDIVCLSNFINMNESLSNLDISRHSTTKVVGGFVEDCMMHRHLVIMSLHWLMFVSIMCDPSGGAKRKGKPQRALLASNESSWGGRGSVHRLMQCPGLCSP
jgi:hypothetical protein